MNYIGNQEDLCEFVETASKSKVLAIDTEFLREKTYFPNLCLLQIATDDDVYLIDPFAVEDLHVIAPLLTNESIMKIFHAGGQDLEILYREIGVLPWPIFDVQVAAALLGQSHQAGLGSLLSAFLGINIKKSDSFTDWTRRPLAPSQIEYAIDDVIYLPELYEVMKGKLEEKGRLHWLDSDFQAMVEPEKYEEDPYLRYKRLKRGNQLTRKQMAAAREVAAWREKEAQRRDLPRKWILTDEQIVEACKREAKSIDDLFMVRSIKEQMSTRDAREVAKLMKMALNSDEESWPKPDVPQVGEPNVDSAVDLMLALVRVRALENGIAIHTLASHDDLAALARGHEDRSAVMHGWRKEIVGNDLLKLLEGKLSLSLNENEIMITEES